MRITVFYILILFCCIPLSHGVAQSTVNYLEKATAVFWTNIDSAVYYLNLGKIHHKEQEEWEIYINCYNGLATCYFYKGEYAKSLNYLKQAKVESEKHIGKDNVAYSSLLNNLAQVYTERGNYNLAIEHFEEAVASAENNPEEEMSFILTNFGRCYARKGDIDQAILYLKRALREQRTDQDKEAPRSSIIYNTLADAYWRNHQPDTALTILAKSVALFKNYDSTNDPVMAPYHSRAHLTMAEILMEMGKYEEALKQIKIAQALEVKFDIKQTTKSHNLMGDWLTNNQQLHKARLSYTKALKANIIQRNDFSYHRTIGISHGKLAKSLYDLKEYKSSLDQYNAALQNFTHGNYQADQGIYPSIDSMFLDRNLIIALQGKARVLHKLYAESPNPELVSAAMEAYDLAIQALSKLRKEFLTEASKENLADLVTPLYEEAMDCLIRQYQMKPSAALLNRCFQLAEASKAIILVESINENLAKAFSGIPDSSLNNEATLRREIAFYEKSLYKLRGGQSVDRQKVNNLEKDLFNLRRDHQELVSQFEQLYPEYHRLKYGETPLPSIPDIQRNLPDSSSAVLEYFVGTADIYLFIIAKGGARVEVMPREEALSQQIETLRGQLHRPPGHADAETSFASFTQTANWLYQQVLCPDCLSEDIDRLIIIPDDVLGYIPYEILLSKEAALDAVNYRANHLDYLFNDYKISYNYSASLWLNKQSRNVVATKNIVAFAPDFSGGSEAQQSNRACNSNQLSNLNCNIEETNEICALLAGKAYTGPAANKASFLAKANQYKILHFATHSCLDDTNPMSNKIFLADGHLSNYDLYNMRLDSDLAVLSACDTGNGQLLKGEGVMSLFRGFLHAGCASSLISLWSVEDCTTKEIMYNYYQQLKAGKAKDVAIQQARKDYLAEADRLRSHPFYWATFVQFGSIEPITFNQGRSNTWIWIGAALFTLCGLIFVYQKSK